MYNIDEIKEQFSEVIKYSQNISNPQLDNLFDEWYEAKEFFISKMGGLIYEHPEEVSFEMNPSDKRRNFEDFVTILEQQLHSEGESFELIVFLEDMKESFYSNLVNHDYICKDGQKIQKGSKLVKSFKYFIENKELLTDIQMAASRTIQKDKVKGRLCLSVHPLDFLSSSENTYNWRSCHALDGEYRTGNLSYMVDKSTIICYLKSDKDEILPNFPSNVRWNSKKWRVLAHFSNNKMMLFAGRQYPFSSDVGINTVKNIINVVFNDDTTWCSWSDWDNTTISTFKNNNETISLYDHYLPIGGYLKKIHDIILDGPGALNYNDLLNSTVYKPMYATRSYLYRGSLIDLPDNTKTTLGGAVRCLECGDTINQLSYTMRCIDCEEEYGTEDFEDFYNCACCGRRIFIDNGFYDIDNYAYLCEDCFEEQQ